MNLLCYRLDRRAIQRFINRLRHRPVDDAVLSNIAVNVTTAQRVKPDVRNRTCVAKMLVLFINILT